ncbi:MAG: tetratricopeptide repeat protein [Treponema sp.]|nr:tetratricopeptide repeat protein [Treponema sp.]
MKKIFFRFGYIFIYMFAFSWLCTAQGEGEKYFRENNPAEAIPLLEEDVKNQTVSSDTYNYLGLAYFQTGDNEKAVDAFDRGMKNGSAGRKKLLFNKGNVLFAMENYAGAESCFSLALTADPAYNAALLNRANARLNLKKYSDAAEDYRAYIAAVPDDPQSDAIRTLIGYLMQEIENQKLEAERLAEEDRLMEEENKRIQEEIARQEAEQAAAEAQRLAEEQERRRKLLEDVANSLQQTDTTNMTAGAEAVLDYEYESELE